MDNCISMIMNSPFSIKYDHKPKSIFKLIEEIQSFDFSFDTICMNNMYVIFRKFGSVSHELMDSLGLGANVKQISSDFSFKTTKYSDEQLSIGSTKETINEFKIDDTNLYSQFTRGDIFYLFVNKFVVFIESIKSSANTNSDFKFFVFGITFILIKSYALLHMKACVLSKYIVEKINPIMKSVGFDNYIVIKNFVEEGTGCYTCCRYSQITECKEMNKPRIMIYNTTSQFDDEPFGESVEKDIFACVKK